MSEEFRAQNQFQDEPQVIYVHHKGEESPVLGILSIVFGAIAILPFGMAIILGPTGLVLGIIGLNKGQKSTSVVGIVLSVIGLLTSPFIWALFAGFFGICAGMY